ncbi:MAG: hypothetical protein AB1726_16000 [Planctomycetota bacterium]
MRPLILVLPLVSGFAGACATDPPFHADRSLLAPWSEEAQSRFPAPPYAARYRRSAKSLTYVASRHEHTPGCATFAVVEREFTHLDPEIVVIEGTATADGASPAPYRRWVESMPPDGDWPGGEAAWSASLAMARGIPFLGGEPGPAEIRAGMAATPFDRRDLLLFYVVRQIPQWKRTGEDRRRSFADLYAEVLDHQARAYELDRATLPDPEGFAAWYAEKNGRPFEYGAITPQESAPIAGEDALYTNRISAAVGLVRDSHLANLLADLLNRHDRVLVVYGAGHHAQQADVLQAMLGLPIEMAPAEGQGLHRP